MLLVISIGEIMNLYQQFLTLHQQNDALLLGNAWDAASALLFQKMKFKAIGTSSAAIAHTLGYQDGEEMPFSDLLRVIKNIQTHINIPLTVDIETGYSTNIAQVFDNMSRAE